MFQVWQCVVSKAATAACDASIQYGYWLSLDFSTSDPAPKQSRKSNGNSQNVWASATNAKDLDEASGFGPAQLWLLPIWGVIQWMEDHSL